jgi:hypothetical protein
MKYLRLSLIILVGFSYISIISCKNTSVETKKVPITDTVKDTAGIISAVDSVILLDSIIIVESFETGEPMKIHIPDSANNQKVYEKQFYQSGSLFIEGYLENDLRTGKWIAYYESGKLWSIGYYEDGKNHGNSEVYYENGRIRYTKNYKNDVAEGLWKFYGQDGALVGEVMYEKGKILWKKGSSE